MPVSMDDNDGSLDAPLAVFTSRQNSHPFQERQISLHEPHKIGRSVARAHPAPSNAIFDCKVLSRNHALLWFEDNKFYLQDTKSSNGTFVNNQRLSKGSEESDPHEIFSGDIIQFGVDVMENSKRVTHGCIMASVTLYLPDGTEAKPRYSSQNQNGIHAANAVHSQEIYQLSQYLQEAMHREQVLEEKLSHLQTLIHKSADSCESGWQALINEDRLLSKLEVLQNQLAVYSKNQTEGSLQQQIVNMEEERLNYETSAKQSLRKVLQEKLSAVQELSELERSLSNAEQECKHLRAVHQDSQQELMELSDKHDQKLTDIGELARQLEEAERNHQMEAEQFEREAQMLQAKLEAAMADKDTLQAKVIHLTQHKESLEKAQLNISSNDSSLPENADSSIGNGVCDSDNVMNDNSKNVTHIDNLGVCDKTDGEGMSYDELKNDLEQAQERIESLQEELSSREERLIESEKVIEKLHSQIDQIQLEVVEYVTKVATLEDKLKTADIEKNAAIEKSTTELGAELERLTVSSEQTINKLKEELRIACNKTDLDETGVRTVDDLQNDLLAARNATQELQQKIEVMQDTPLEEEELTKEQKLSLSQRNQNSILQVELQEAKNSVKHQVQTVLEYKEKTGELESKLDSVCKKSLEETSKAELANQELREQAEANKQEFSSLKDQCASLRQRIHIVESDLKRVQHDNSILTAEVNKWKGENCILSEKFTGLSKTFQELNLEKEELQNNKQKLLTNLTDAQKQASIAKDKQEQERIEKEALRQQCKASIEELEAIKFRLEATNQEHSNTKQELNKLQVELRKTTDDYSQLAERSKALSACSTLPLLVLVFAVIMALYPFLSRITATNDGPGS